MNLKILTLISLSIPPLALASPLQLSYSGTVTQSTKGTGVPSLSTQVEGNFYLATESTKYTPFDIFNWNSTYASYEIKGSPYLGTLQAAPWALSSDQISVEVFDNDLTLLGISEPGDAVSFGSKNGGLGYVLLLRGQSSSFSGTTVPIQSVLSNLWTEATIIGFDQKAGPGSAFVASIGTVKATAVPEPSSTALLGIAMVASILAARKRGGA